MADAGSSRSVSSNNLDGSTQDQCDSVHEDSEEAVSLNVDTRGLYVDVGSVPEIVPDTCDPCCACREEESPTRAMDMEMAEQTACLANTSKASNGHERGRNGAERIFSDLKRRLKGKRHQQEKSEEEETKEWTNADKLPRCLYGRPLEDIDPRIYEKVGCNTITVICVLGKRRTEF